jgi:hypothetical protein
LLWSAHLPLPILLLQAFEAGPAIFGKGGYFATPHTKTDITIECINPPEQGREYDNFTIELVSRGFCLA